ncbi:MAG: Crp/Fnr family transcriptional regulator [Nitrospira sp.]|nr:Crp/Fnr family transcriptional regulator [Nitrospira sp.]
MTETRYGKGEYIFREGDPTEYFHIVKEGSVKCVKSSLDGKECTLKVLMPGDLFCCDAATFDGAYHPGTAQPMGEVSVLRMKKEAYFKMLRANPDAAMEVIRYLGNRLNEAQEKAKVLALDRADQRLAALLVDLAERSGVQESNGLRITVRLTRQDMANMVGSPPKPPSASWRGSRRTDWSPVPPPASSFETFRSSNSSLPRNYFLHIAAMP